MLISIEGLDGSGKSTVVEGISKQLNLPVLSKCSLKLFNFNEKQHSEVRDKIYSNYSSDLQALYYLIGYLSAYEDGKQEDYILDRSALSTYYFSYNEDNHKLFDFFFENYGSPDLTIILYASKESRLKRIKLRNPEDEDLKKERIYVDDYSKYFEAIERYDIPYLLVNTESLTQGETIKIVRSLIIKWNKDDYSKEKLKNVFSINNIENLSQMCYSDIVSEIDERGNVLCKKL